MQGIKTYQIHHSQCTEVYIAVQIDFNHPQAWDAIKACVNFFNSHIEDDDDYLDTYLMQLASTAINMGNDFTTELKGQEGYPPADGSYGITITRIRKLDLDESFFLVQEEVA